VTLSESLRARWSAARARLPNTQTETPSTLHFTSHLFRHGQCIYTLYVQYFFSLITRQRRVSPWILPVQLVHYGIFTFPSQCQRHLKAVIHLQMASVKKAPFLANHVAVARSSVTVLTLSARDVLRAAIKVVSTSCKEDIYHSADSNTWSDDIVPERHPSRTLRNWRIV
jgi:hypothetical protein